MEDDELITELMTVLEIDHQYVHHVEAWDEVGVSQIRRCGRRAGRLLGYGIRTFVSDADRRDDGLRVVTVVVTRSTAEEEGRIRERGRVLLDEAFRRPPH